MVTLGFPGDYIAPQGKAKACRNAYKGGTRAILRNLPRLLREHARGLGRPDQLLRGRPEGYKSVLLVGVASFTRGLPHDPTCLPYSADHPFIRHTSYVNYANTRIEPADALIRGVEKGSFDRQGSLDETVFARVCKGLMESRHVTLKTRNSYENAVAR